MDNRQHLLENALYAFNSGKTKSQWIEENKNTNLSHIKSGDFGIDMFWNIAITMNNICKHCKECNISSSFINNEHNRINALELSVQNIFMSAICIYKTDTTNSIYDKASKVDNYIDSITLLDSDIKDDLKVAIDYVLFTYCPNCT